MLLDDLHALIMVVAPLVATGGVLLLLFRRDIRSLKLKNASWQCLRCGHCCRLHVVLQQRDIERLCAAGYTKDAFLARRLGIPLLKKTSEGACVFLQQCSTADEGVTPGCQQEENNVCIVYAKRPAMCRRYPVFAWWFLRGHDGRCPGVESKR